MLVGIYIENVTGMSCKTNNMINPRFLMRYDIIPERKFVRNKIKFVCLLVTKVFYLLKSPDNKFSFGRAADYRQ